MADVCATLGVSPRHLTGEFHRLVGLSPKTFSRIVRFRRALTRAATRAPVDWAALAATCEYYDQAHFNRDFRRFSGVTPTAYQRQRAAVFGAMAEEAEQFLPLPPA